MPTVNPTQPEMVDAIDEFDADLMGAEIFEFDTGEEDVTEPDPQEDLQAMLTRQVESAVSYREDNVEDEQVEATDYYYGREFGNEEDGRSKVVSSDVRDAVLAVMPSLLRVFTGSERFVEFRPRSEEDTVSARQKTDYVNMTIMEDNPGFLTMHSWMKDALVRRIGVVKFWWNEFHRTEGYSFSGQTEPQLGILAMDENVEIDEDSIEVDGWIDNPESDEQEPTYSFDVLRKQPDGRVGIAALPPEEFVYSPGTRMLDLSDALMCGHIREGTVDEARDMGVPDDMIRDNAGKTRREGATASTDDLRFSRKIEDTDDKWFGDDSDLPEEVQPILLGEIYMLFDGDGDNVAELRKFTTVGPKYQIVPDEDGDRLGEVVNRRPFAIITPDPEPHTVMGMSFFDLLRDVQRVKSQILRATLDSLGLAVEPQQEVVAHMVNMRDLLSPELSGILRVRAPGQVREVKHAFVGGDTLPMLDYYDKIRERRTGQGEAAQGLDPDVLQSTTKAAVTATVTAAQQRMELIARIFAETGVKTLFKGVLELIVENQDEPRMVRLNNEYVLVDPRSWDADMDVTVNVALGSGLTEERLAMLGMIAQKQMELLQMGSPLVNNVVIRNTLGKIVELAGFKNSAEFFNPWDENAEQQMQQQLAEQPPQPDPATMIAQAEVMKAQGQIQRDTQKLALEREEMLLKDDRERDKVAREMALRERIAEIEFQAEIRDQELKAAIERDRAAMDADTKRIAALAGQGQGQQQ